jgi:hypothetical protein
MLGGVVWIIYTLLGLAGGDLQESNPLDILIIIAWLLQVVGLVGFHTLQNRDYGRIGRGSFYTFIVGAPTQALGLLLVLAGRDTWRASNRRRGVRHNGWVDFVWCSYFASQGIAAVVRHSDHRSPTRHDTLGGLRRHVLWTRLASTGLHALVTQGSTV